MTKGTPSFGKKIGTKHVRCRRCGRVAYNLQKKYCSACGYGRSSKIKQYSWMKRTWQRIRKK